MSSYFDKVPENIQKHINNISINAGQDEQYREDLSRGWLEKMEYFEKETELIEMRSVQDFEKDNKNGLLVMTYSGSLLNIGPLTDEGRFVEYASIGLRIDVPESAEKEGAFLAGDIETDEIVTFKNGPISKSSPVYAIAVMQDSVAPEEQEEKLEEVTQILADEFMEVNKTIIIGEDDHAEIDKVVDDEIFLEVEEPSMA